MRQRGGWGNENVGREIRQVKGKETCLVFTCLSGSIKQISSVGYRHGGSRPSCGVTSLRGMLHVRDLGRGRGLQRIQCPQSAPHLWPIIGAFHACIVSSKYTGVRCTDTHLYFCLHVCLLNSHTWVAQ